MNTKLADFITQNSNSAPGAVRVIQSGQGATFIVDGKEKLNLCSSHYLGFAMDERLKKAAKDAIDTWGIGTGYRTLAGTNSLNVELEERLAKFKRAEAAIVLPGGYLANMTAIQTIMTKDDIIISDELNHASIIDAVRLSGVKNKYIYKHRDMDELEGILKEIDGSSRFRRSLVSPSAPEAARLAGPPPVAPAHGSSGEIGTKTLIVTDGVFSMDGDLAPLPEIVALAEKYGAITMVDDAHGEGVLGKGGRGIVDHFELHARVDIEVGTLSKAFSVIGGFITGKKELIDFYKQKSRQFMFTSALTAPDTAALLEAVTILQQSDELVSKLWENARFLKKELVRLGFDTGHSETPITPIMIGDEEKTRAMASALFDKDVFASAITFPLVPKGTGRIRLIPSAAHSKEDLATAVEKIRQVGKTLQVI